MIMTTVLQYEITQSSNAYRRRRRRDKFFKEKHLKGIKKLSSTRI